MAALTARRGVRTRTMSTAKLPSTQEQTYQGGEACWDSSTGLVKKAAVSTTLTPIGTYMENKLVAAADPTVTIQLHREVQVREFANDGANPVVAGTIGGVCYLFDDQTVSALVTGKSIAGRVWALDGSGATATVWVEVKNSGG